MRAWAVFFGIACGCNSILGIGDVHTGETIDAGADARPDAAACPASTVCGASSVTWLTAAGPMVEPDDISGLTISAIVPDGSGGTTSKAATISGNSFQIAGVPDGSYTLKIISASGLVTYFITDQHIIDLGFRNPGRPDAEFLGATPIKVHFVVTGMTPWQDGDFLTLDAYNVGVENWDFTSIVDTPPAAGATQIDFHYDWGSSYTWRSDGKLGLVDAAKGDQIQLGHMRPVTVLGDNGVPVSVNRMLDTFTASNATFSGGAAPPDPIGGAWTNVGTGKSLPVTFNRPVWDAMYPDGWTALSPFPPAFSVVANPLVDFGPNLGPPIAGATVPVAGTSVNIAYDDPYPAAWKRTAYFTMPRQRFFRVPGAATSASIGADIENDFVLPAPPLPSNPAVIAPSGIQIAGQDALAGGHAAFDGSKPLVISWNKVAAASYYAIAVDKMIASGGGTSHQYAGSIYTTDTTVSIPAELLTQDFYVFVVEAVKDDGSFVAGRLRDNPFVHADAGQITGMWRLGTHCGDTVVQTPEECDPGANESATCDADCTKVVCGDGYRNVAAGELCDSGGGGRFTFACNNNCTPNKCGDGIVNPNTEACDSSGVDTAACNANCTVPVCGDSYVNAAAGETCDPPGVGGCPAGCH